MYQNNKMGCGDSQEATSADQVDRLFAELSLNKLLSQDTEFSCQEERGLFMALNVVRAKPRAII
jgi:hypothetical protein